MRGRGVWTIAAGLGLAAALGIATVAAAQEQSVTLTLASQNDSGISGTATISQMADGKLQVMLKTSGSGGTARPAHIHRGTCANLQGGPVYNLTPVANDASTTTVDGSLQDLLTSPHAIHMHKSDDELTTYVACADIEMSGQQPATTGAAAPAALPATGSALPLDAAAVGLAGLGLTLAGLGLRRRRA